MVDRNVAEDGSMDPEVADEFSRTTALRRITVFTIGISALYTLLYVAMGWSRLALFNGSYIALYSIGLGLVVVGRSRVAAIYLVICGLTNLIFHVYFFITPESGVHYFLLVIPIFSVVAIHPKDVPFAWLLSGCAMLALATIEWQRTSLQPLWAVDIGPGLLAAIRVGGLMAVALLLTVVVWGNFRVAQLSKRELLFAHARSEELLLNVLPGSIAARLKENDGYIADNFPNASVLFADIVGFTPLSEKLRPDQLIDLLNVYFGAFDELVLALGLEKIKTIGDAYMVAGGVPHPCPDHLDKLLRMAQEMCECVDRLNRETGHQLALRIGVNQGPVVAGVIGTTKFSYDLWGDVVNVASRMESSGVTGRIQVTQSVVESCGDGFEFERRGAIAIKGKGEMEVFLLKPSV